MKPFIIFWGQKYSSYNISIMVGIILAICLFCKIEKNISNAEKDDIVSILGLTMVFGILSAILGNKILHFISWDDFKEHLFQFTGMTFFCGLMGGLLFFVIAYGILCRDFGKVFSALNVMIPYFIVAQMFGRLGCLLGGCCYGKPTEHVWGMQYPKNSYAFLQYGNQKLYPVPIMEICLLLLILICTVTIFKNVKFMSYLLMYSAGRFFIEYFRGDNRGNIYMGLSPSQRICIMVFIVTVIVKGISCYCSKRNSIIKEG